jgi:toxin ParE1/3/4
MSLRLSVAVVADTDLQDHAAWLRNEAGQDTADRFLAAADREFVKLVDAPGLGSPVDTRDPELAGAQKWRVTGFPRQLIFYVVEEDALVILRVLHAASDWRA